MSVSLFTLSLGVEVILSSWAIVSVSPTDSMVPSDRDRTPPVGIEVTVMVRVSPSASVGAPIPKEAAVSSVERKR